MTAHELADESLGLLIRILSEAHKRAPANELRCAFIYRHARNISDLADDVLALERENRSSGSRVIVRPMIESLFKLVAAVKVPGFAAEKVVAEIDDELDRIHRWLEVAHANDFRDEMDETINLLQDFARRLRQEHNITTNNRWNVFETARAAQLDWHYAQDYFLFSKHVHSTISGIISQEYETTRGHTVQTTIFVVLAAAGHVVQAIETATPQVHIDEATRLLALTTEFVEQGAFRDQEGGPE